MREEQSQSEPQPGEVQRVPLDPALQKYLDALSDRLRTLVDCVWRLKHRCIQEAVIPADEAFAAYALLRQTVAMAEGVATLARASLQEAASVAMRAEHEAGIQLRYMLEDPAKWTERAVAWEVADLRRRLHQAERCDPETDRGREFAKLRESDRSTPGWRLPEIDRTRKELAGLRAALESERYRTTDLEFEKSNREPHWYAIRSGPSNLGQVASRLGLGALHRELYADLSNTTHGGDATRLTMRESGLRLVRPLHDPRDLAETVSMSADILIISTLPVLKLAMPSEALGFGQWCKEVVVQPLATLREVTISTRAGGSTSR